MTNSNCLKSNLNNTARFCMHKSIRHIAPSGRIVEPFRREVRVCRVRLFECFAGGILVSFYFHYYRLFFRPGVVIGYRSTLKQSAHEPFDRLTDVSSASARTIVRTMDRFNRPLLTVFNSKGCQMNSVSRLWQGSLNGFGFIRVISRGIVCGKYDLYRSSSGFFVCEALRGK